MSPYLSGYPQAHDLLFQNGVYDVKTSFKYPEFLDQIITKHTQGFTERDIVGRTWNESTPIVDQNISMHSVLGNPHRNNRIIKVLSILLSDFVSRGSRRSLWRHHWHERKKFEISAKSVSLVGVNSLSSSIKLAFQANVATQQSFLLEDMRLIILSKWHLVEDAPSINYCIVKDHIICVHQCVFNVMALYLFDGGITIHLIPFLLFWGSIWMTRKINTFPVARIAVSMACHKGIMWNIGPSILPLQWRHNGRDAVLNHQSHDCLLNCSFWCRSKKTSTHRVPGLCGRNSPVKYGISARNGG